MLTLKISDNIEFIWETEVPYEQLEMAKYAKRLQYNRKYFDDSFCSIGNMGNFTFDKDNDLVLWSHFSFKYKSNSKIAIENLMILFSNLSYKLNYHDGYLLRYWAYECSIKLNGKSYLTSGKLFAHLFTSTDVLSPLLYKFIDDAHGSYPPVKKLYKFLTDPKIYSITDLAIQQFINTTIDEKIESETQIKKAARIIFQGYNQQIKFRKRFFFFPRRIGSSFSKLPKEINIQIASLIGNPHTHSKDSAEKISKEAFSKPKLNPS